MWGSTPRACSWPSWWCAQLPSISSMPRLRLTTRWGSSSFESSEFSKSMSPTLKICRARFMRANWRGVGSKVSGLAPAGTSTSMSKSEPTMPPMIVRNGRIETTIVRSSVRGVSPHAASSRGVTSRRRYFLMVDVSCDKDKKKPRLPHSGLRMSSGCIAGVPGLCA